MAKIIKCDICGGECTELTRYTLIKHPILRRDRRLDICYKCIDEIEKRVKKEEEE